MEIDKDKNGKIDRDEFEQSELVQESLELVNAENIRDLFDKIDTNKNGTIEYSEFITATLDRSMQLSNQNLEMAFAQLAKENENVITRERIEEVFISTTDDHHTEHAERNPIWEDMRREFGATDNAAVITKDEFFRGMKQLATEKMRAQA